MGRRKFTPLLALACASGALAGKKMFNIQDDLLAFPQYQVRFPDEYILDSQAKELAQAPTFNDAQNDKNQAQVVMGDSHTKRDKGDDAPDYSYEEMNLEGQRFLCQIPRVQLDKRNETDGPEHKEEEQQKELARATDRGLELLREMEGKCMYYVSGWWSYSLCYKSQIKQFHALPSGAGIRSYPPTEDPTTHSFVLGKFPGQGDHGDIDDEPMHKRTTTDIAELQTKGGSRYLVQRLEGGTTCDLTGKSRKIEIQFHCHPQSTDRIGWIKELTTCSYLMVVYTPRLCNDVAFLPPQQEEVHPINCREILRPDEVADWEAMREYQLSQQLVDSGSTAPEPAIVGDIEVGAQQLVGKDGRKIEKGRVASVGEEKVEVVAKRENGEMKWLSKGDLQKKYDLDPDKVETLRRKLEEMAEGKDWTLEVVESNGERGLRGIVDTDEEEEEGEESLDFQQEHERQKQKDEHKGREQTQGEPEQGEQQGQQRHDTAGDSEGSQEIFKDEL